MRSNVAGTDRAVESGSVPYAVEFRNTSRRQYGEGTPSFTLTLADEYSLNSLLHSDAYAAAIAFVRGEVDVRGDLVAAIRFQSERSRTNILNLVHEVAARFAPRRIETWLQTKNQAAESVRFHYDCSNDFYQQFLDSRMQYSAAYYKDPKWPLETAQLAKLDHICRKLDLHADEQFLDIGCGWGGLAIHAAEHFKALANGYTVSRRQFEYAVAAVRERGLRERVTIGNRDYRDIRGRFHKIASVGMFEHVGRHRLRSYFEKVASLLEPDGLFLNSGIVRPQQVHDGSETLFLQRYVFPGGELAHLSDVIREAENAGFQILDVEDMRLHYALTCRAWVARLQENAEACRRLVSEATYRTWLLYLAASAASFEDGFTYDYQLLMTKRGSHQVPLTREHLYQPAGVDYSIR